MFSLLSVLVAVGMAVVSWDLAADATVPSGMRWALLGAVLVPWWVGGVIRHRAVRLKEGLPASAERYERAVRRAGPRLRLSAMLAYGVVLFGAGWAAWLRSRFEGWVLVDEILLLAPYLIATGLAWLREARLLVDLGLHDGSPARFAIRQYRMLAVPLAPLTLMALGYDGLSSVGWDGYVESFEYVGWVFLAVFVVVLFSVAPFLFRFALDTRPLPAGPLRDDLETLARSMNFKCREILVWRTPSRTVNAAIVGFAPSARYVLLTDGLIARLTRPELLAVFAHEAAHGRRGHPIVLALFATVFLLLFYALSPWIPSDAVTGGAVGIVLLVGYWFVGFGYLSRRLEREADLYGAAALGRPDWMIAALARIEMLVGRSRGLAHWLSTWRHFSIGRRIDTLRGFALDPGRLDLAHRVTRRFCVGLVVALAITAVGAASRVPRDHAEGRVRLAMFADDLDAFERAIDSGLGRYPSDPWFWFMHGLARVERGDLEAAERSFRTALEGGASGDLATAIEKERAELAQPRDAGSH